VLENTSRNLKILAGAAGVNLVLALAVTTGAVPRPGDNAVRAAAVSEVQDVAAPAARQPGDGAPVTQAPASAATPAAAAPAAPTTTIAKPKTTTVPPTTKAPSTTRTTQAPAVATPVTAAPTPAVAAAAPVKVPRRTPSAAEVQSVITQLKQRVGGLLLLVSPTPAQIDQAGDQVCTAFDNGQSFAQVKATGLSMIPASVTVSADTVDWAVRTAVALYCPGHANKLV
jgi:hypothetical protein